jgi:hypothetical protein
MEASLLYITSNYNTLLVTFYKDNLYFFFQRIISKYSLVEREKYLISYVSILRWWHGHIMHYIQGLATKMPRVFDSFLQKKTTIFSA